MITKKLISRGLFLAEILIFCYFYFFSSAGLQAIKYYERINSELSADIVRYKKEISDLEKNIAQFSKDPFYKEELARTQLHMGYEDEIIYCYSQKR